MVGTRRCPGSLCGPVGPPVVPGWLLGGSVVVVSALSSVLWSLLRLGLRVHAALVGVGYATPLTGVTGFPSPTLGSR